MTAPQPVTPEPRRHRWGTVTGIGAAIVAAALIVFTLGLQASQIASLQSTNSHQASQIASLQRTQGRQAATIARQAATLGRVSGTASALQASSANGTVVTCDDLKNYQNQLTMTVTGTDSAGDSENGTAYEPGNPWLPSHCYKP